MALWDLYLESETWWACRTGWSVYGMIREVGQLMENPRFKHRAARDEKHLTGGRIAPMQEAPDVSL